MHSPILLLAALLAYTGASLAHGNVHERIHDLDREIARHPQDADLLIKRGRLLLDEGHADDARDDLIKARRLAPERLEVLYYLARTQLMRHQPDAALESARTFLRQATNDAARARGHVLVGDVLSAAAQPLAAAEAYLTAIGLSQEIKPDQVIYAADAFHRAGNTDKAIAVLNDGIARLGPLHALNERALALELEQKQYEPALIRVDRMLATHQRLPFLLYQKGLILKALARIAESRATFTTALKEIHGLPESRRQTSAFENLRTSLLAEMN